MINWHIKDDLLPTFNRLLNYQSEGDDLPVEDIKPYDRTLDTTTRYLFVTDWIPSPSLSDHNANRNTVS